MPIDSEVRALIELTEVKGAIPALVVLSHRECNAKDLSRAISVADETGGRLREHFLSLGLVAVKEVPAGGTKALEMSLTAKGRRAAKGALEIARSIV